MMKIFLTFILWLPLVMGHTTEKIKIGTFIIPKYVRSNSEGEFVQLVKALAKRSGVEVEIVLIPPKRAYQELELGTIQGLFPVVESRDFSRFETITDFYTKEMYIFEKAGVDYKKLKTPKVCTTEGYTYPEGYIQSQGWKKVVTDSDETCLKLLDKKRVDIFIGEVVTVNDAIRTLGLDKKIVYDKFSPITSEKVTLAFKKSSHGKKLSDLFDKALKEIMIDRSYDKIFSTGAIKIEGKK